MDSANKFKGVCKKKQEADTLAYSFEIFSLLPKECGIYKSLVRSTLGAACQRALLSSFSLEFSPDKAEDCENHESPVKVDCCRGVESGDKQGRLKC